MRKVLSCLVFGAIFIVQAGLMAGLYLGNFQMESWYQNLFNLVNFVPPLSLLYSANVVNVALATIMVPVFGLWNYTLGIKIGRPVLLGLMFLLYSLPLVISHTYIVASSLFQARSLLNWALIGLEVLYIFAWFVVAPKLSQMFKMAKGS